MDRLPVFITVRAVGCKLGGGAHVYSPAKTNTGQLKHFKALTFVKMSDSTENEYFTSPGAKQLWSNLTKHAFSSCLFRSCHVYLLLKLCFEFYTTWPKVFGHILIAFNMSSKGLHCFTGIVLYIQILRS